MNSSADDHSCGNNHGAENDGHGGIVVLGDFRPGVLRCNFFDDKIGAYPNQDTQNGKNNGGDKWVGDGVIHNVRMLFMPEAQTGCTVLLIRFNGFGLFTGKTFFSTQVVVEVKPHHPCS
jgi:hypothetical protein